MVEAINPATEEVIQRIESATAEDTDAAIARAKAAFPGWRDVEAGDRARLLRRLVHLPMGRFAEATEIANAVLFLATDDSSYVMASTFLVDGDLTSAYVTPVEFENMELSDRGLHPTGDG